MAHMQRAKPNRVQLKRTRGWRMPSNTTKVDRSTKWGNPFKVGALAMHPKTRRRVFVDSKETAIALFALYLKSASGSKLADEAREELRGKHLACWCKHNHDCHADLLLALANGGNRRAA